MAVGKEITFASIHSLPTNDDVPRDLGNADIGDVDLSSELLRNGWAKLKEMKREPSEADNKKKELENEAKAAGKGIWNPHGPKVINPCLFYTWSFDNFLRHALSITPCLQTHKRL